MKETEQTNRRDALLSLYEKVTDLWIYSGNQFWSSFNAFLLASSILVSVIALSIAQNRALIGFAIGSSAFGLVLCVPWFLLMKRGFEYDDYWRQTLEELEQALSLPVKPVSRVIAFGRGEQVKFDLQRQEMQPRLSGTARLFRTKGISFFVIFCFIFFYTVLFGYSLFLFW